VKIADLIDMENLMAVTPGYIYWLNRDNVYEGCNDRCAKVLGLASRDAIVGLTNADFPMVDAAISDVWARNNLEVMESRIAKLVEEPAISEDGQLITMIANKVPLFDKENNVIGLLGISLELIKK
jgi:PAS domain-containing protein